MILTQEHKNVVIAKINQLWTKSRACSICSNEKWNLSDRLFSLPQLGGGTDLEKQHYPAVVLTCQKCGKSLYFNAMTLGFSFNKEGKKEEELPLTNQEEDPPLEN